MRLFIYIFKMIFILTCLNQPAFSQETLPKNLTSLASYIGLDLYKKNISISSLKLLENFTTQQNLTFCGIASAVIILNASDVKPPKDYTHPPYSYFTQENFFTAAVQNITTVDEVSKQGINLSNLAKTIQSFGLEANPIFANTIDINQFRSIMISALHKNEFVIVNFFRPNIGQKGGLHHSPVAAYDHETDQFLILDVSRYKYPAYWVSTNDLWNGVNIFSNNTWHGLIVIKNK